MALTRSIALLLLALGVGFGLWSSAATFGKPWQHGWLAHNGARYSLAGRNFERQGMLATWFVSDLSAGPPGRMLYVHHPPLTSVVVGLARERLQCLWRDSEHGPEDRARLVFWLLAGVNVVLVFALGRRLLGEVGGGVAAIVAGFLPITSYYGTHVEVQGSLVSCCILSAFLAFLHDQERPSRAALTATSIAVLLGMTSDWPAYYLAGILPLLAWLRARRLSIRVLGYPALAVVALGAHQAQVAWTGSRAGVALDTAFAQRSAGFFNALVEQPTVAAQAVVRMAANIERMYPWPVLVLTGIGLVLVVRAHQWWVLGLLAVGALHILIFPAGATVHDYWSFALLPGVSLLAAAAVMRVGRPSRASRIVAAAALVVSLVWCAQRASHLFAVNADGPREYLLGKLVHDRTDFADVALTNGPYNPLGGQELTYPEFSYYADRRVVGGVTTVAQLEQLMRAEHARYVLLGRRSVWPEIASEPDALAAFLHTKATAIFAEHGVTLYRLNP